MTIIELLIVLAVISILAAIAIWNYFLAIERTKQKRTMADIRTVAMAWETYSQDSNRLLPSGQLFDFPPTAVSLLDLESALVPRYLKRMPNVDGWGRPFDLGVDTSSGRVIYAIRSRGRDGLVDPSYDDTRTTKFDCDIVFSNGVFVVYPADITTYE